MVYAQLVGRWIIRKGAGIYTYVGWHRHCTSESRSILEHLGSLLASRIYCPAVPSGHWSSVTVQTSRASTECSHWADCIAYLTLRFRASLGIWARKREKAYVHPQIEGSTAGLRKMSCRKPKFFRENFPKVTFDIALFVYFLPGQRANSILCPN